MFDFEIARVNLISYLAPVPRSHRVQLIREWRVTYANGTIQYFLAK